MKNKTVTQHAFSLVPKINKPRSVFTRNCGYKTTLDCDYLVPFYFMHVMPGDSIRVKHSILMRLLSSAVKPIMDNMQLDWYYFFVPYRLVWANFQKFMGEQASPADSISYTIPQCTGPNVASGGIVVQSLHDYFGLPVGPLSGGGGTTGITFNNLIPRSYNKIYLDWFKDENLQNAITLDTGDGPDTFSNYVLLKGGKKFDYFTSCLPNLQKGTAVTLSLGTSATVKGNPTALLSGTQTPTQWLQGDGTAVTNDKSAAWSGGKLANSATAAPATGQPVYPSNLYADLSTATSATINTLRQSIALQQFLENDARGGTRYTEIVKQRWGVTSPDARLQRSEILSLGTSAINLTSVPQTTVPASVTKNDSLANLGAFGTGSDVGNGFNKSFTEHGTIIGLMKVRADLTYQQGIDRHWSYRTRYDLYNPEFALLGEQSVLNKEVFANIPDGTSSTQKDGVFGYQERYAEERYARSMITGKLRSGVSGTLDVWHLSQEFSALPTLGSTFITLDTPLDRCISVPSEPQWIADVYLDQRWARVMPMFGVPGLMKL
ncbi:MAG: major capsid protein [Microvirus sp.]|nr:MAG: major capsid protein [Microvirus sp.]